MILIIQTIVTLIESINTESSIYYISQWNLILLTILFSLMAFVQVKNARRLTNFKLDFDANRSRAKSINSDDDNQVEMPWLFWKWIVPAYISITVIELVLFFDFLVAEISKDPFLIYGSSEGEIIWEFLIITPTFLIAIEFPFNQIPFDWRHIIFPLLLFTFYLLLNLIIVAALPEKAHIYEDFDWFEKPGFAMLSTLASYLLVTIAFAIFWALTMKCKLPRYQNRKEERYNTIHDDIEKYKS